MRVLSVYLHVLSLKLQNELGTDFNLAAKK
jgi:hypothetical protein